MSLRIGDTEIGMIIETKGLDDAWYVATIVNVHKEEETCDVRMNNFDCFLENVPCKKLRKMRSRKRTAPSEKTDISIEVVDFSETGGGDLPDFSDTESTSATGTETSFSSSSISMTAEMLDWARRSARDVLNLREANFKEKRTHKLCNSKRVEESSTVSRANSKLSGRILLEAEDGGETLCLVEYENGNRKYQRKSSQGDFTIFDTNVPGENIQEEISDEDLDLSDKFLSKESSPLARSIKPTVSLCSKSDALENEVRQEEAQPKRKEEKKHEEELEKPMTDAEFLVSLWKHTQIKIPPQPNSYIEWKKRKFGFVEQCSEPKESQPKRKRTKKRKRKKLKQIVNAASQKNMLQTKCVRNNPFVLADKQTFISQTLILVE